jgi:hypothetical protein
MSQHRSIKGYWEEKEAGEVGMPSFTARPFMLELEVIIPRRWPVSMLEQVKIVHTLTGVRQ